MKPLWKRDHALSDLKKELRGHRTDPPPGFLRALTERMRGEERWLQPKFRMSLVYSVALLGVIALLAAGGFGLVRGGASGASHLFSRLASSSSPTSSPSATNGNPANKQYKHKCGDPPRDERCEVDDNNTTVKEPKSGCTNAVFTLTMPIDSDQIVTATYTTLDGTASTTDGDYQATSGTATFSPGQTSQSINVPVCHDTGNTTESFSMYITGTSSNAVIGALNPATGTIQQ